MDRTGATAEEPLAGGLVENAAAASTEACREGTGGGRNPYANFTLRHPSDILPGPPIGGTLLAGSSPYRSAPRVRAEQRKAKNSLQRPETSQHTVPQMCLLPSLPCSSTILDPTEGL